jgi:hypothetical protein
MELGINRKPTRENIRFTAAGTSFSVTTINTMTTSPMILIHRLNAT